MPKLMKFGQSIRLTGICSDIKSCWVRKWDTGTDSRKSIFNLVRLKGCQNVCLEYPIGKK